MFLSRTSYARGATLIHGLTHALCEVPSHSRQLTYASTSQNTRRYWYMPLTVPSAVHLTACISIRITPSRTLCGRITVVISASSVCLLFIFYKITMFLCVCQQKHSISYSFYLIQHHNHQMIVLCTKYYQAFQPTSMHQL